MPEFNPPEIQHGHTHFASRLMDIDDHRSGKRSKFWIYCIADWANGVTHYVFDPEFADYAKGAIARGVLPVFGENS